MKNVLKALGLLVVLLILCTLVFVQSSGTDYSFTLKSDAVSAPVDIVFDDMAVPHIYAESEERCHVCAWVMSMPLNGCGKWTFCAAPVAVSFLPCWGPT